MLVEFTVGNYLSFREPQTLSLVASSDTRLPGNVLPVPEAPGLSLLKSVALYGANASGKSNLLRALDFATRFVQSSAAPLPGGGIPVVPFRLDAAYRSRPSEFELVFIEGCERYTYGFRVDGERVHEEWLTAVALRHRARSRVLFRRGPGGGVEWGSWRGERKALERRVRPDALLLSVAAQFNNPTATDAMGWFTRSPSPLMGNGANRLSLLTSSLAADDEGFARRLTGFMRAADLGIVSWAVERRPVPRTLWEQIPPEAREGVRAFLQEGEPVPKAVHLDADGEPVVFDLAEDESAGTAQLYALAGLWLEALHVCPLVTRDELETSLHPLMARHLIESLHGMERPSQLVFSTHDCTLLDRDLLRRDQIWFTEKDRTGATKLYSLWDFRVRHDEDLQGRYLKGRYGAVPFLGTWSFEDDA